MTLPIDKLLHFLISALMVLCLNAFFNPAISAGVVILIGVAKEAIWDYLLKKGTPELEDIFADLLGVVFGSLFAVI